MVTRISVFVCTVVLVAVASAQERPDRAQRLLDRGKPYKAILRCDHLLVKNGEDAQVRAWRGQAYNAIGNYDQALTDARRSLALDPGNAPAEMQTGIAFIGMYAGDSALAHLTRCPEGREKELRMGMALALVGRCAEARSHFDRILQKAPDDISALRERAGCHAMEGDSARAREDLDRAIALDPHDPVSWNARGYHRYAAFGEHEKAIRDYDRAIKINPNYSYAFNNRGWSRFSSGEVKGAERDVRLAGKKNPANPYVDLNLGLILLAEGDTANGCMALHKAIGKGGTPQRAEELRSALASCPEGTDPQGPIPPPAGAPSEERKERRNAPGSRNAP
ncbi:MAG: tetratricopeptide repeat protein [Flavobacteriales bacterium]|nr:tetratricopeptide repeat protein [Flavobacteriales bacterium]MCB9166295.1 tetratricopeptide repeat protein [Flavobacteriales bacterium]